MYLCNKSATATPKYKSTIRLYHRFRIHTTHLILVFPPILVTLSPDWNLGLVITSKLLEPAPGHWSMTLLRRGPSTHCLLWRTTPPRAPPRAPCPWKHYFPNIEELLQRTRSLPFNSVCFPERNTSKTAFHRIIIGSSWILTKAQNPFMLEKPRRNFLERSQISLLLLFLSLHSSFSSFSFRCRRLLCLIPGMDRQAVVSGSLSRCKMLIHPFSPLFLLPVLIDYEFAIGASRFSVAHKVNLLLHRGKPCYLGWQTRAQPRKKWKINGPGLKQNSKWLCSLYHLKNSFCCAIIAL